MTESLPTEELIYSRYLKKGNCAMRSNPGLTRILRLAALLLVAVDLTAKPVPPQARSTPAKTAQKQNWENQGKQLIQAGRFHDALVLFRRVKQRLPKDPRPYFYSGLARMQTGDLSAAASELSEAVRLGPDKAEYSLFLASALTRLRQKDQALKNLARFESTETVGQLTPAWMWLLADTYYRSDQPDSALRVLDVLEKRTPRDAKIDLNRGEACVIKGQLELARKHFERSIEKQPENNPAAHYELGKLLHQLNEIPAARKSLETAVRQAPHDPQYLYKLALVCQALNQNADALQYLHRAEASGPQYPEIFYALGRAYQKTGNSTQAEAYLKKFQQSNAATRKQRDQNQELGKLVAQGEAQLDRGNAAEARRLFEEALKVEPNDWSAHGYLAEMFLDSVDWQQSYPHLARMEAVDPDSVVGNYLMARYWYRSQNTAQALDYAERARALRPANAELRNLLGQIYSQLGKHTQALKEFEEAVKLAPGEPDYQDNLKTLQNKLSDSKH